MTIHHFYKILFLSMFNSGLDKVEAVEKERKRENIGTGYWNLSKIFRIKNVKHTL